MVQTSSTQPEISETNKKEGVIMIDAKTAYNRAITSKKINIKKEYEIAEKAIENEIKKEIEKSNTFCKIDLPLTYIEKDTSLYNSIGEDNVFEIYKIPQKLIDTLKNLGYSVEITDDSLSDKNSCIIRFDGLNCNNSDNNNANFDNKEIKFVDKIKKLEKDYSFQEEIAPKEKIF